MAETGGSTYVHRKRLGIEADPTERSCQYPGHEERMRAHEERVRAFYDSREGRSEEGAEAVLGYVPDEPRAVRAKTAKGRRRPAPAK